jgi:hypothetical protein
VTLEVVTSPTIFNLTTLEVLFTLLENIHSTGISHDNRHLRSYIFMRAKGQGSLSFSC